MEGILLPRVVHVVVDGIQAALVGARVLAGRASAGRVGLSWGVGDKVAIATAAALEGVVQVEPVTSLMSDGLAQVEVGGRAAGDTLRGDDDAVEVEGILADDNVLLRESGIAEQTNVKEAREEVDIESGIVSPAKSLLVCQLILVVSPLRGHRAGNSLEDELEVGNRKVLGQNVELSGKSGVLHLVSYEFQIMKEDLTDREPAIFLGVLGESDDVEVHIDGVNRPRLEAVVSLSGSEFTRLLELSFRGVLSSAPLTANRARGVEVSRGAGSSRNNGQERRKAHLEGSGTLQGVESGCLKLRMSRLRDKAMAFILALASDALPASSQLHGEATSYPLWS